MMRFSHLSGVARLSVVLLAGLAALAWANAPARADSPDGLAFALAAADRQDWAGAAVMADGRLSGDIIAWMALRSGNGRPSDYAAFLDVHPDWPGLPLLRAKGEAVLDQAGPGAVAEYFADQPPQTGAGALALTDALLVLGQTDAASAAAVAAWRALSLTPVQEDHLLARFGPALADHHGGRMAMVLTAGDTEGADRMLPRVTEGTRAVAAARIALQRDASGIDAAIAAVPARMAGSAGLALDRFRWRLRKDRDADAAALLLDRSTSAEALGDPAWWADAREPLARGLMRAGQGRLAYDIASRHFLPASAGGDGAYAALEWLAGYIALRKLDDPKTALAHFRRFRAVVDSPISLGRAGYWEGRAAEALGREDEARAAYGFAASFQTSFYGLLAAEREGLPMDPSLAATVPLPDWQGAAFTGSSVFRAADLLRLAGADDMAERFVLHLAERLDGGDLARLAAYALDVKAPHMALLVAKQAATRGTVLPRAYFPVTGLAELDLPVPRELALAIARRESEFDTRVVSGAGARGLMQVMPDTARAMAKATGEPYDRGALTADWRYNARLGAAYLARLRDEFGTSGILVAAGYNAGPGRPRRWISEMGDPRRDDVDAVDWIEAVPFEETRNYIMRVTEAVPVYRARLAGGPVPIRLTDELKGR